MEFWTYYRAFRRRRWLYVGAMLVALAVGVAVYTPRQQEYQAQATLSLPSSEQAFFILGGQDLAGADARTGVALNLLGSRELAARVVQREHLSLSADALRKQLVVGQEPGSRLVTLYVRAATPAEAVKLANDFAEEGAAIDEQFQSRESTLAREFIQKQVDAAHTSLQNAENELLAFNLQNGYPSVSGTGQAAASLQGAIQSIDFTLLEDQSRIAAIRSQMSGQDATRSDPEITNNPVAQQLREQLVGLEVALTSQLAIHTDNYPDVIALRAKIKAIKDRLTSEVARVVASERIEFNPVYDSLVQQRVNLESDRVALLAKREALSRALGGVQHNLPEVAQTQLAQTRLERNISVRERQYGDLLTRFEQARLREQEILDLGVLTVVDHADGAQPVPIKGPLAQIGYAALFGLLAGGALAYFLDYLDNGLGTPEKAERLMGVPVLAAIPRHNPPFEEAYRLLQVSLSAQAMGGGGPRVLAITSPRPRAGTSTVVANLAQAFAHAGRRTLVVDAGVHQPAQHFMLGVRNDAGVAELLAGKGSLPKDPVQETDVPNLWVLPAGSAPIQVNGLLSSPAFADVLGELKRRFDVILVDTPPAGAFADTLRIAPLANGVLLVLDARQAPRDVEERVKTQLGLVGATLRGLILTKVRPDLVDSYVYQQHFYEAPKRRILAPAAAAAALAIVLVAGPVTAIIWLALSAGRHATWMARHAGQWLAPDAGRFAWAGLHTGQWLALYGGRQIARIAVHTGHWLALSAGRFAWTGLHIGQWLVLYGGRQIAQMAAHTGQWLASSAGRLAWMGLHTGHWLAWYADRQIARTALHTSHWLVLYADRQIAWVGLHMSQQYYGFGDLVSAAAQSISALPQLSQQYYGFGDLVSAVAQWISALPRL